MKFIELIIGLAIFGLAIQVSLMLGSFLLNLIFIVMGLIVEIIDRIIKKIKHLLN